MLNPDLLRVREKVENGSSGDGMAPYLEIVSPRPAAIGQVGAVLVAQDYIIREGCEGYAKVYVKFGSNGAKNPDPRPTTIEISPILDTKNPFSDRMQELFGNEGSPYIIDNMQGLIVKVYKEALHYSYERLNNANGQGQKPSKST